jgi:TonB family protein
LNGKGILIFFWLIISSTSVVAGSFQGSPEPPCDLAEFGIFDFAPSFLDSVGTECPEVARRAGIEGRVELRIFVNKEGSLECLTILEKAHPILEKQAVLAAQRSTYMPALFSNQLENPKELSARLPCIKNSTNTSPHNTQETSHAFFCPLDGIPVGCFSMHGEPDGLRRNL